ncbi:MULTISPECIES: hypothetical protein [Sphingobacterium]|uniref:hypothetical protein n=1 Tax=Sphingobacterium TaxID=28453 RepID=UPI0013D9FEF7|nr:MULTISPECIES: hypothetical protein [unclassified Sphingobacterium]
MNLKLTIALSYLLIIIRTQAYGQERKKLTDFEEEYLERVYIKYEDRLTKPPFVNSSFTKLYSCITLKNLPKEVPFPFSYDTLVNTWIKTASDSITLNENNIIELSDILLNSANAENAYKFAEIHYKDYLGFIQTNKNNNEFSAGYATGWTRDFPPSLFLIQPTYLFVFYDQNKKLSNYIGINSNIKSIPLFSKRDHDPITFTVRNQIKYYIENKLHPKQTRQQNNEL